MHKITVNGIVALETAKITETAVGMATAAYRIMNPGQAILDIGIIYA
jgi:hypothetical protein